MEVLGKMVGQVGQHRVHPMEESTGGDRDRNKSLWRCWTWSWIIRDPSGEGGTSGSALLCIGQVVTWQY